VAGASFVLILVKSYDTASAVARIAPYLHRDATVVSLQNGLGNVERIRQALPAGQIVLGGVTTQAARRVSPGLVLHTGEGLTYIGYRSDAEQACAESLVALLNAAGMPAVVTDELNHAVWQKLAINSAINGPTAIAKVANGDILRSPHLLLAAEELANESARIALANGVRLEKITLTLHETLQATASNRSSMLQDIEANRRTEVDAIYGAQIRAGTLRGVPSPALTVMDALVRAVSRENPLEEDE
ncbi:MAG: 2-dehydropantoate 2-reductase, partial [Thermomicrobiales bacterium]